MFEKPDVYAVHLEMWIGLLYVESRHVIIFLTNSLPHFLTQVQKKKGFGLDRVQSRSSNAKSRTLQIPSKKTETWWEYKLSFKYSWIQGQISFHFSGYNILVQLLEFWTFVVELLLGILCKHNSSTGKKFYETSSIIDFLGEFYF